ncbi:MULTISPECIES: type II CAAX endopeptidase family protein [unclassified Breznakia]|uniref:CPBP family intramembrane glutamic endopeptidase n=1 Tax=unclassified Breznakia TaxID=2623764 RepID=UPI002474BE6A|nr:MULTISPECIES: type II CAAX endopeptidase family protein [unclassified Breznakia]MDH6367063.1 membrane protease YdiL (CAAX protease family) [Breznakia sp. PH1-1]MDH6404165.1 membrane protease YdiL (CAAX protease family) [Breznakia sp. PF1-11]MDH6411950.1 membrane protease YdiL (CAAX protease family) [Breznakia sp. PFB1-11]MDH6414153.1 membrane protease YdiL (CAAX protease family) [Breznakia sp. PFB1-14]MDH6418906.1 membrane protease YdiL (CAAX protease family) [Breznakia sp. PFB1-12]
MNRLKNNTLILSMLGYLVVVPVIAALFPKGNISRLVSIVLIDVLAVYMIYRCKDHFQPFFQKIDEINTNTILLVIACMIILISGIFFAYFKFLVDPIENNNEMIIKQSVESLGIVMIVSNIIFVPIFEEILFKILLYKDGIVKKFKTKPWLCIVGLSVIFAGLHLAPNLTTFRIGLIFDFSYYLLFGLVTYFTYRKTDNILFPIVIHIICNLIAYVV